MRVRPEDSPSAFIHNVGDLVALSTEEPPLLVLERHHGNFGAVYIMRHSDGSVSAVKTIRADIRSSKQQLDAFVREATSWVALPSHPSIVTAYWINRYGQFPYVDIAYVPQAGPYGGSVAGFLRNLAPDQFPSAFLIVSLVTQILDGLRVIEEYDSTFTHGDIKPTNVLLYDLTSIWGGDPLPNGTLDFRPLLTDFGLARSALMSPDKDRLVADWRYLAPEWLVGDSALTYGELGGTAGHASDDASASKHRDVFALGCTMFELAFRSQWQRFDTTSGRIVSLGDLGLTMRECVESRNDLSTLLPVVFACLSKDSADRPGSYAALLEAWEAAAASAGYSLKRMTQKRIVPARYQIDGGIQGYPLTKYLVSKGYSAEKAAAISMQTIEAAHHRNAGQVDESDAILHNVLQEVPDFAPALAALAYGRSVVGDDDQAIVEYLAAIPRYEADLELMEYDRAGFGAACATASQLMAVAPQSEGMDTAVSLGRKAVDRLPDVGRAHLGLGLALMRAGQPADALPELQRGLALDPGNRRIAVALNACASLILGHVSLHGMPTLSPEEHAHAEWLVEFMSGSESSSN